MSDLRPYSLSAVEISQRVRDGSLSLSAVAEFYLRRTKSYAQTLNSHLYFDPGHIEAQLTALGPRVKAGEHLPLAGVPILVKDNICTRGIPTTCASRMLEHYRPPYDAHAVERLVAAGAIIFGKTNCDEFGMGSSNEHSAFGPVRNPWNLDHVPGGSSGGSAAAVAADLAPAALGSDTGGSIRQPAAFCGIYGLKPTYGVVSRFGLIAYGSSLDQIGPLANSVEDLALLLDVISEPDSRDSTNRHSFREPLTPTLAPATSQPSLKGLRFGIVEEFFGAGLDGSTRSALQDAVKVFESLGARIQEVSLPSLKYSISAYYLLATAEASANLARFDGIRFGRRSSREGSSLKEMYQETRSAGFGREVKQRIMLGTFALSSGYYEAYYGKATAARALIAAEFAQTFGGVDVLLAPTSPTTAYRLGEKSHDPLAMYLGDICTLAVNLAGLPALSAPCGFDARGLPIGMQLIGPALAEATLLRAALAFERTTQWTTRRRPQLQ